MKKLFLLLFFILLLLPIIQQQFHMVKEPYINENRYLSQQPKFNLNNIKEFPSLFENFFNDNFGFRPFLIQANSYIKIKLLSKQYVDGIIIGQDGWLFLDNGLGSINEPAQYTNQELVEIKIKQEFITKQLNTMNIYYLEMLIPDKNSVYPNKLPVQSNRNVKTTKLKKRGETTLLSLFNQEKKYPVYYKTDSHWNRYGSYLAYRNIIENIAVKYPQISAAKIKNNTISLIPKKGGDLANIVIQKSLYSDFETQFNLDTSSITNTNKLDKIIIYYDSFFDPKNSWSTVQFLKENFREVKLILNINPLDLNYIKNEKPNVVLFEKVERALDIK